MDQYVCVTCGRTDSPEWRKVIGCHQLTVVKPAHGLTDSLRRDPWDRRRSVTLAG